MKPKDLALKVRAVKRAATAKIGESWLLFIATLAAYLIYKNVDYSRKMQEAELAADRAAERAAERVAERVVEKLKQREEKKMQETLNRIEEQEN